MNMRGDKPSKALGFTLVELLIVVAILAILMSLVVSLASSVRIVAHQKQTETDFNTLRALISEYRDGVGKFPDNSDPNSPGRLYRAATTVTMPGPVTLPGWLEP